jgi:hypothetical protein
MPQAVSAEVHGHISWCAEHVHNCAGRCPAKITEFQNTLFINGAGKYLNSSDSKSSLHILSHSKRHFLWNPQSVPLFKTNIVVDVDNLIVSENCVRKPLRQIYFKYNLSG